MSQLAACKFLLFVLVLVSQLRASPVQTKPAIVTRLFLRTAVSSKTVSR